MSAIPDGPILDAASAAPPRWEPPWWAWVVALASIFAAGLSGVLFAPVGSPVALWWPAAGLAVLWGVLHGRRRLPWALLLVLVATFAANAVAGRSIAVSGLFGLINAAEVAIVVAVLGTAARAFRLSGLRPAVRFTVAVMAAAVAAGVLAAAVVALLEGGAWWPTAAFVAASHAAAVSMLAPVALLPKPLPVRAGPVEMVVQVVVLAAVVLAVFWPGQTLPLAFAPYIALAWAAFRFPIRVVLAESVVGGLAILVLTLRGGGPFAAAGIDLLTGAALVELFLVTFSSVAIVLVSAQYELRALSRRLDASTRLLTGSLVDAQVGLAIVQRVEGEARIAWSNPSARSLLADELDDADVWDGPVLRAARAALASGEPITARAADRTITLAANRIDGEAERFAIQKIVLTEVLAAQEARLEAEIEHDAARSIRADLERQRDDFLATTSHELRTPITSIVGYTELLADAGELPGREREWVEAIDRNAVRLSQLVEDLLTLSSASAEPGGTRRREPVRCREVLDEAVAAHAALARGKGVRIEVVADDEAVLAVRADLARAVGNVLANALKFTPAGGRVALSAHDEGAEVAIAVADTGPGMSEASMAHAFERFYRAPEAERDSVPGTGLGLAIVAELVRRNAGTATLRANADGGLTAVLRLASAVPAALGER